MLGWLNLSAAAVNRGVSQLAGEAGDAVHGDEPHRAASLLSIILMEDGERNRHGCP